MLFRSWKPVQVVVGEPHHADDAEHDIARRVQRFARQLEGRFGVKVALVDESYSSVEAESKLNGSRTNKAHIDAGAACEILRTWLSENNRKFL